MPDHVDALMPGLFAHLVDECAQSPCHGTDVIGERRVVEGVRRAEPATVQTASQEREDRAIVEDAVDQHDGRAGGFDVADEKTALGGWQSLDGVPLLLESQLLLDEAKGVHREVGGDPGCLDGDSPSRRRREESARGAPGRGRYGGHRDPGHSMTLVRDYPRCLDDAPTREGRPVSFG